jgi:hypothetical protein
MTLEQALLSAISGLLAAVLWLVRVLWKRSEECETDRRDLRQQMENERTLHGEMRGFMMGVSRCPTQGCPFKGVAPARPARHVDPRSSWSAEGDPAEA